MTRESVLGLEAVLADGTSFPAMNRMLKNNAAYDLKQLFIGTEGTLGVVTRLVLRLRESPRSTQSALVACPTFGDVTGFLKQIDGALGGSLAAFEVMWNEFYRMVTTPPSRGTRAAARRRTTTTCWSKAPAVTPARDQAQFEEAIGAAIEAGLVVDAVVASSEAQREGCGPCATTSKPFSASACRSPSTSASRSRTWRRTWPRSSRRLEREWPAYRRFVFGHLGDGNLHIIAAGPPSAEARHGIERCVYEPLGCARRVGLCRTRHRPREAAVAQPVPQPGRTRADARR